MAVQSITKARQPKTMVDLSSLLISQKKLYKNHLSQRNPSTTRQPEPQVEEEDDDRDKFIYQYPIPSQEPDIIRNNYHNNNNKGMSQRNGDLGQEGI